MKWWLQVKDAFQGKLDILGARLCRSLPDAGLQLTLLSALRRCMHACMPVGRCWQRSGQGAKAALREICSAVNNIGTNIRKPTVEYNSEDYDFVMNTNLRSCYRLSQACPPT